MQDNNTVEVMIGGRVYNLSGYEDVSYLQKVAAYINGRDQELMKQTGYAKQKPDMQNVLLQLTLADDYFKCNCELENIKRKYHDQEKEMYRLKHELVSMKMKYQTDNK
ncbi:MAG: cell division protein ZapA [Lachnospiraceae bacterium]|nr:cell division protein ZapA [Lachnospiraceae bacterium]